MRYLFILLTACCVPVWLVAQQTDDGPANEKAQKTYKQALEFLRERDHGHAIDGFKKADKEDGGHCHACELRMVKYGVHFGDWKTAELGAAELLNSAKGGKNLAIAHYTLGMVLMNEALSKNKNDVFARVHDEMTKAVASYSSFPGALFDPDGYVIFESEEQFRASEGLRIGKRLTISTGIKSLPGYVRVR